MEAEEDGEHDIFSKYDFGERIGQGGFGQVLAVTMKRSKREERAVKVFVLFASRAKRFLEFCASCYIVCLIVSSARLCCTSALVSESNRRELRGIRPAPVFSFENHYLLSDSRPQRGAGREEDSGGGRNHDEAAASERHQAL